MADPQTTEDRLRETGWDGPIPLDAEYTEFLIALASNKLTPPEREAASAKRRR